MKPLLALLLLLPACLCADELADRHRIQSVFDELNGQDGVDPAALKKHFAPDIDPREAGHFLLVQGRAADRRPWSETTIPHLAIGQVRFVTPDVALVDATLSQFGSVFWRRQSMLFVLRKEGPDWQVVSIRMRSGTQW
jgi:hypothetical protein